MQVLLHRSEYGVVDTWYASGLIGSGSKDVLVDHVGQQIGTLSPVQIKFAEASAAIDTAEMLYRRRREEMMAIAHAGEIPSPETRAIMRRDSAYGGHLFTGAVDLLVEITGAAGLYTRNPMQRYFRDARHH